MLTLKSPVIKPFNVLTAPKIIDVIQTAREILNDEPNGKYASKNKLLANSYHQSIDGYKHKNPLSWRKACKSEKK